MKNNDYDIAASMAKNLAADKIEENTNADKLSEALDCLNKSAELFEDSNNDACAFVVTNLLEKISTIVFTKEEDIPEEEEYDIKWKTNEEYEIEDDIDFMFDFSFSDPSEMKKNLISGMKSLKAAIDKKKNKTSQEEQREFDYIIEIIGNIANTMQENGDNYWGDKSLKSFLPGNGCLKTDFNWIFRTLYKLDPGKFAEYGVPDNSPKEKAVKPETEEIIVDDIPEELEEAKTSDE